MDCGNKDVLFIVDIVVVVVVEIGVVLSGYSKFIVFKSCDFGLGFCGLVMFIVILSYGV